MLVCEASVGEINGTYVMKPQKFEGWFDVSEILFGDVQVANVFGVDIPKIEYRLFGMLRFKFELRHYLLINHIVYQQLLLYSVFLYFSDNFGQRDICQECSVHIFEEELPP